MSSEVVRLERSLRDLSLRVEHLEADNRDLRSRAEQLESNEFDLVSEAPACSTSFPEAPTTSASQGAAPSPNFQSAARATAATGAEAFRHVHGRGGAGWSLPEENVEDSRGEARASRAGGLHLGS